MSGTSIATPVAAAVVALLLEIAIKQDDELSAGQRVRETSVKTYGGITDLLKRMSPAKTDGKYTNVVPWQLLATDLDFLDSNQTLFSVAVYEMRKTLLDGLMLWKLDEK